MSTIEPSSGGSHGANERHHREDIEVTVIVDGVPRKEHYSADERVEEVIKSLLSPHERHEWAKWQITDERLGDQPLEPSRTLEDAGVRTGDVLSLTKKDGGGGRR